jgi:repressor LexA
MKDLTNRQKMVLGYIMSHKKKNGYIPTIRKICDHFKFASVNAAHGHERALFRKGFLAWKEIGVRQSIFFPRIDEFDIF